MVAQILVAVAALVQAGSRKKLRDPQYFDHGVTTRTDGLVEEIVFIVIEGREINVELVLDVHLPHPLAQCRAAVSSIAAVAQDHQRRVPRKPPGDGLCVEEIPHTLIRLEAEKDDKTLANVDHRAVELGGVGGGVEAIQASE